MGEKIHIYYDAESDYLELRFGEPTESRYDKIGEDTFVRIDEKTGEKRATQFLMFRKAHPH